MLSVSGLNQTCPTQDIYTNHIIYLQPLTPAQNVTESWMKTHSQLYFSLQKL